jgi:PAS domain S-box-containing protein
MDLGTRLELLAMAANMLPVPFLLVNSSGEITLANRRAGDALGYDMDELRGLDVDALVPPAVRYRHAGLLANFVASQEVRMMGVGRELTAVRKDGSEFPVEIGLAPVDLEGETFVAVQLADVTAVESMRTSLARLVDSIDGIIFQADAETFQMEFVSRRAEEILGYPIQEWLHAPTFWADHIHDADRESSTTFCRKETRAGRDHAFECRMVAADGRIVWFRDFVRVFQRNGKPWRLHGIMVDITKQRQAEESRERLEKQIQGAQKLASLAVLAGGIAHDFNNLLVGVLGNAGLILEDLPPESPIIEQVRAIETAARRAADLTHQMLAYSGKGRFITEAIDLNRLIKEMAYLLQAAISKTVVIKYDVSPQLPRVLADPTQIRQVVMNLLTNASDAIGSKSGVITVSTGLVEADANYLSGMYLDADTRPGRYLTLEVSDTGCGMDEETAAKMFDPFFSTKFAGRGLGLAATLGIIRGHNGALKVYTEPKKGTTIKVLLPASEETVIATKATPGPMGVPVLTGWALIIDDDEAVRSVLKLGLERLGFDVMAAGGGQQGLEALRDCPGEIRLVFLDLTMPHMDGEEAFRGIRLQSPECRVILMSGYNEQEATSHFVGKGLAGFLQKPFDLDNLARVVLEALDD